MDVVYFEHEGEGGGTYDGGHAYLHKDDGSTGDEGRELGWITIAAPAEIAREHGAELDVDGPSREEWEAGFEPRPSLLRRLLGR